jgi:hypothetical protein
MRKIISVLFSVVLLATTLVGLTPLPASASATLITCTDLTIQKTVALKELQKSCRPLLATATWRIQQSDSSSHTGAGYANLRTCTSKRAEFNYVVIKSKCAKDQVTNDYWRSVALPAKPLITQASSDSYESAFLTLASDSATNTDAPIAYYTITSSKGDVERVYFWSDTSVIVSGLSSSTSYTFTISATSVDGTSPVSESSLPVTTQTYIAPVAAATTAPLAAPAFTLSSSAATVTVNSTVTVFTTSSTGGTIASFAINATPAGMSFSTSTGTLTGKPTSIASATTYTVTATNASGSATRTFALTVNAATCANGGTCIVGDRGPGGGIVYYVSASNFTSSGSNCNTACKYLEVAPAGWNNGAVVADDPLLAWSSNTSVFTGQDTLTAGTESLFANEKFNWKIGQGLYNTSIMKVAGATSAAQAAVLAYAGSSTAGQWFIPSMNELNELCKYARGQETGILTAACSTGSGTFKSTVNAGADLGGFVESNYWSSTEQPDTITAWLQYFLNGFPSQYVKSGTTNVRPIRAF